MSNDLEDDEELEDDDGICPGCRSPADEECDPECEYYEL